MIAEALLGALQGLGGGVANMGNQKEAAQAQAAAGRSKFQEEILKGLILQSMKKNGRPINYDLMTGDNPYVDPAFMELIGKLTKGRKGTGVRRISPHGMTPPMFPTSLSPTSPPSGGQVENY